MKTPKFSMIKSKAIDDSAAIGMILASLCTKANHDGLLLSVKQFDEAAGEILEYLQESQGFSVFIRKPE